MTSTPKIAALIVAAGRGTRAGGAVAKQWQPLCGKRVIDHTLTAFQRYPKIERIIIVLSAGDMAEAEGFTAQGCLVAEGGADRAASVRNGLALLGDADLVLIHDAARPCVTPQIIDGVIDALATDAAAAPGLPVTDALWVAEDGAVAGTQDRTALYAAPPQSAPLMPRSKVSPPMMSKSPAPRVLRLPSPLAAWIT